MSDISARPPPILLLQHTYCNNLRFDLTSIANLHSNRGNGERISGIPSLDRFYTCCKTFYHAAMIREFWVWRFPWRRVGHSQQMFHFRQRSVNSPPFDAQLQGFFNLKEVGPCKTAHAVPNSALLLTWAPLSRLLVIPLNFFISCETLWAFHPRLQSC